MTSQCDTPTTLQTINSRRRNIIPGVIRQHNQDERITKNIAMKVNKCRFTTTQTTAATSRRYKTVNGIVVAWILMRGCATRLMTLNVCRTAFRHMLNATPDATWILRLINCVKLKKLFINFLISTKRRMWILRKNRLTPERIYTCPHPHPFHSTECIYIQISW